MTLRIVFFLVSSCISIGFLNAQDAPKKKVMIMEIKDEIEEERQHKLAKEAKLKDQLELDRQKRLDDAVIAQVRADLAGNQSDAS